MSTSPSYLCDLAPTTSTGSLGTTLNVNTFLKEVNVSIDLNADYSDGKGSFVLENPSNISENLELYFDPGSEIFEPLVNINGIIIPTREEYITETAYSDIIYPDYNVTVFDVSIESHSTINITIYWKTPSQRYYYPSNPILSGNSTTWEMSYFIIGKSCWNHSIDKVDVTFNILCDEFRNYYTSELPHSIEESNSTISISYHYDDFSYDNKMLTITGKSTSTIHISYVLIGILSSGLLVCLMLIYLIKKPKIIVKNK